MSLTLLPASTKDGEQKETAGSPKTQTKPEQCSELTELYMKEDGA